VYLIGRTVRDTTPKTPPRILVRYCPELISWGSTHFSSRKNMSVSKFRQNFGGCRGILKAAPDNRSPVET
jgi:hypothetical protein